MSEVNEGLVVFPMNNNNNSSGGNNNNNNMYHVPQQSRREKLRYQNTDDPLQIFHQHQQKQQQSPFFSRASHMEPFTGYAAVLEGSRFLAPAQQMLEEMCDVGLLQRGSGGGGSLNHELVPELQVVDKLALDGYGPNCVAEDGGCGGDDKRRLKAWLISTLDEVYKIYKQYFQQMRAVIASFESIAGLRNAVPFASLAMKTLSKHYCSVKDAIADQLCFTNKALSRDGQSKEKIWFGGVMNGSVCYRRAPQGPGAIRQQQHVWRSQRGLPERAVAVLKAWLFEHFLHPYPTDTDKHMLAKQTGLSRNQVSNWFINARVRLWKPLVEEIHSLEQHQGRKVPASNNFDQHPPQLPPTTFTTNLLTDDKQAPQDMRSPENRDTPPGWLRNELPQITSNREVSLSFSNNDVSPGNHPHPLGGGNLVPINAGYSGVSLTLGLQQNNGLCIAEPIPLNVAQHFGIGDGGISYVTRGSENQDHHYIGKDINGEFLRDFIR